MSLYDRSCGRVPGEIQNASTAPGGIPANEVRIHTLDDDDLIAIAQSRLSRDMTEEECEQYFRRSCEDS